MSSKILDAYVPRPIRAGQLMEVIEPLLAAKTNGNSAEKPVAVETSLLRAITAEDPVLLREMVGAVRAA